MTNILSPTQGWAMALVYASAMIVLVVVSTRKQLTTSDHYLAARNVGVLGGALSIAVSWIWAPAIFFCALKAYNQGLPGAFWFTVPNVLCFLTFALVAVQIRKQHNDQCTSMPDYFRRSFPTSPALHIAAVAVVLIVDIVAILFNCLVGASLLNMIASIPFVGGVFLMTAVALTYAIWRGLPASIVTDVVQMSVILALTVVIVPWAIYAAGGLDAVYQGIGGKEGIHKTIFETKISFSWGIPASISLLAVPFADQMFYQRAFAAREKKIFPTFILGGIIFGIIPTLLCLLGFLAANPTVGTQITNKVGEVPPLMINVAVVATLLPEWTVWGFALMAICALSSTLDSAYCAVSSIIGVDLYRRYINPQASDRRTMLTGNIAMAIVAVAAATLVSLVTLKGEWLFNINGAVASCIVPPLLLSLLWPRLSPTSAFLAIIVPLVVIVPFAVYANITGDAVRIVVTMIGILVTSSLIAVLGSIRERARG